MKIRCRILIHRILIIGFVLIINNSCKKEGQVPVVTTSDISNITETTSASGGDITSDGGSAVTARGICWNKDNVPTISNNKTSNGTGLGSFTSAITGLSPNTTYNVRAYATNSAGTGYGNSIQFTTKQVISDIDGNVYHAVTVGGAVWMVENLKVTRYRNGDPIPNVTDNTQWSNLTTGAYCDYNNTQSNSLTYGKLYNWYAVTDSRNLCPTGWHIPSNNNELNNLIVYWGLGNATGGKLKETGTTHWQSPNTGATNIVGFTALPGGMRFPNYQGLGTDGWWWTSSGGDVSSARFFSMSYIDDGMLYGYFYKTAGLSVRCVKDN